MGICGGYQMLGRMVHDPDGVEGDPGSEAGLGLLDVETVMAGDKTLRKTTGKTICISGSDGLITAETAVTGYEIHMGQTNGPDRSRGWLCLDGLDTPDGATSVDGRVLGCYLHGLFGSDDFRHRFLAALGGDDRQRASNFEAGVDAALDELADHLETCLDLDGLLELAKSRGK
jgi:adenosylcobyric acid synthase